MPTAISVTPRVIPLKSFTPVLGSVVGGGTEVELGCGGTDVFVGVGPKVGINVAVGEGGVYSTR